MNLSPQDFKALLDSLNRIAEAIEGKAGKVAIEKANRLFKALEYAIKIIESYELDCRDLEGYIKKGYDIKGFCQGTIYKDAIKDIKKLQKSNEDNQSS